ncbi:HAUS augmin-like complex subunit 5 isoform X2 [Eublepharis macularius]|uniref:HAUS augmin-like complex subunit 5 isoform X2 n=1 Tax=Eublepharis macularius TaxID=481883 RepID=A0AA97KFJ0_EUBMA|nr:HAUS augmin-like complex subunit 5 isoform X2 [Eublepharis macularius]
MERSGASLAQELRRWAAEEMKLPPGKIPSESAARRMCSGQCADIWKYVIRHVRHQRNVKKIRGNLLWYQQMEGTEGKSSGSDSEKERRKQLVQGITRLRGELDQIDLQIKAAQRELAADEVASEVAQEKIRDAKHRTLLLKAYSARVTAERQQLRTQVVQVRGRLEQLQEMERKARTAVAFGSGRAPEAGFPSLEPEVLRDVREACRLRFQFLKTLFEHSVSGNCPSGMSEEQLSMSYQHWLSIVERVAASHPPAHILSALRHLALQNTQQLQELADGIDIPRDVEALKFRYASAHLEDVSDAADDLPSVQGLIQEGWGECEMLCVQQLPLQAKEKQLSAQLEAVVQEMHRLLSDGSERSILARAVFELELRAVKLRGYRDGLLSSCRQLEEAVRTRYEELQGLQAKRQRILDFRHLVNKKQEHIRTLIKGTSYIKSQLRKDQNEIKDFIEKKLLPQERQVELEAQKLHNRVDREVQQFKGVALLCLLHRDLPGQQRIPTHELSIHRLNRTAPAEYRAFFNVCNGAAFPLYKAPEQLLSHVAELKKALLCLRAQLSLKQKAMGSLQRQLDNTPEPSVQALMQEVQANDQEQARELLPRVLQVTDQCKCRIERWQEMQVAVDAWWEQPGQFVLPGEQRFGFTLQQWLARWTVAAKMVQQKQPQPLSWV